MGGAWIQTWGAIRRHRVIGDVIDGHAVGGRPVRTITHVLRAATPPR